MPTHRPVSAPAFALFVLLGLASAARPAAAQQGYDHFDVAIYSRVYETILMGDPGGMTSLDRCAEQLWLTLFAKAPEITLFDWRQMERPLFETDRGSWQGQGTSIDFEETVGPYRQADGSFSSELTIPRAAGVALQKADRILGELGIPVGVKGYRPFHATGEDFLHSFVGMIGIPIELGPAFPEDADAILLTEYGDAGAGCPCGWTRRDFPFPV